VIAGTIIGLGTKSCKSFWLTYPIKQLNQLIQTSEICWLINRATTIALNQPGFDSSSARSFKIFAQRIADVPRLVRLHLVILQGCLKNPRIWFGCADARGKMYTGESSAPSLNQPTNLPAEYRSGKHSQSNAACLQLCQGWQHVIVQPPRFPRWRKELEECGKEFGKGAGSLLRQKTCRTNRCHQANSSCFNSTSEV
jgi:hypothetical protein